MATASAAVVTYVPVHVPVTPGVSVVGVQVKVGGVPVPPNAVSAALIPVSV